VVDGQYVPLKWGDLPKLNSDGRLGESMNFCVWGGDLWRNGCETKTERVTHQKPGWWQLKYFWNVHPRKFGEDEPILTNIFQLGWFNHQLDNSSEKGFQNAFF